jgi:hypothetical protein
MPLADLATPSAQAFHAEDRRESKKTLFALIVRPGFPCRVDFMRAMKGSEAPGLMALIEWGPMDWPPLNRKVMALIYERPTGGRIMSSMTAEFRPIDETDLLRKVVSPIYAALRELRSHNVTHRAIRPTNMFWATAEKDRIVLGDCATVPPAYEQPALLETIESSMCHPAGRGPGAYSDDIYAFGASISLLLAGRNPVSHFDDEAVLRRKIIHGSFAVLVGDGRLSQQTSELLRGSLCDDPHERWTTAALDVWCNGQRLPPLLAKFEKRAARGMAFGGKEYGTARELAVAFCKNWDAVSQLVLDGRLELWVRRSLELKDKADAIGGVTREAVMAVNDKRAAAFDTMVAKACMVLDGRAPIRYKTLAAMPDGIGALLAVAIAEGTDIRIIAEALMREVPKAYFETRDAYSPENSMMEASYRDQKVFLDRASLGNGIERVLYELNESVPCLSPFLIDDYVLDIRDLLPALNVAAKKTDGKGWPVDRHIAAFIGARANFEVERQMADLMQPDPERAAVGMLNLLALIQWRLGQGGLSGLATWVGALMQPAVNTFHNRDRRKAIEKEIPRLSREGNLVELSRLLDAPEERTKDAHGFTEARTEWLTAQRQIADIEAGRSNNTKAIRFAQQLAALISVTISLITVLLLLLKRLF